MLVGVVLETSVRFLALVRVVDRVVEIGAAADALGTACMKGWCSCLTPCIWFLLFLLGRSCGTASGKDWNVRGAFLL